MGSGWTRFGFTIHFELFFCREGTENVRKSFVIIEAHLRRYRLGVRTEDSQSSNPGSIPGSATNHLFLPRDLSYSFEKQANCLSSINAIRVLDSIRKQNLLEALLVV